MMTFDKIKESITDFCKEMNEKYIGVKAVFTNAFHLVIYYNDNSNVNSTKRLANIKIKKYEDNTVLIKGVIYFGDINEHSYKYDTVCTDLQTAYVELLNIFLKIEIRIKKEINDNNKREIDNMMKYFSNQDVKALCESYEKQYNIRNRRKEELLSTVYRYFYDCKNKMKEKDYIDAHISGISVKEDEACGASFYYKTGYYDVYCDYHHNVCSIYVYTSDYKEIKIKGSIVLNRDENMIIDISVNENNYKAMLYMLNKYIEDITTTISGGGTVTSEVLIMDNEKILESYLKENHKKEIDNMKKEDMKELMKLALNLKHGLINCCNGYFKNRLVVKIIKTNDIGDFIVKVSGINMILDDESTNVVAEIKVESTQKEDVYYIKNDHLAGNSFGISKVICSNENRLPIIKDELKNSFNRIEEFLKYIKKEEDNLLNKKLKDQYDTIVEIVNSIKDKLFIQLLNYDLSKSIKFDMLDLKKDNSVRFLITADFTHLTIADVNITINGLNDIDIVGAFINKNKEIDTGNSIHCNDIEELGIELDNIIVNVASTIGKVRYYIYDIEFRQIKDFVWYLNNMILKEEEFKIETIYHNYKDSLKIEFLINSENKNNFIVVEETEDYKFLVKYELFGLSSHKHFTKSDELNNYIQTLYEKIKHVVKSLG